MAGKKIGISGANGFLGRNLLDKLVRITDDDFVLLVRSDASIKFLLERFHWVDPDRISFVKGDVTKYGLADKESDWDSLKGLDEFWHLAASTSFSQSKRDETIATNVGGTKNVLDFFSDERLKSFNYVGTAYISGTNGGLILEDKLPLRNGFKNPYEESKWESEKMVRESDLPWFIARPSILIGRSDTGSADGETRMFYGYAANIYAGSLKFFGTPENFARAWRAHKPTDAPLLNIRLKGIPETKKNIVCIDDAVNVMVSCAQNAQGQRKTIHLTNVNYIDGSDIKYALNSALRVIEVDYVGEKIDFNEQPNETVRRAEQIIDRRNQDFGPYTVISDPQWDVKNTTLYCGRACTLPCSEMDSDGSNRAKKFAFLLERFIEDGIIREIERSSI